MERSTLEATELTPYLWGLMGFITVCTLFEYYDTLILNLALPYLGRDFQADARELGLAVGAIQLGTVAAFFLVRLADRYGRRPVLLLLGAQAHEKWAVPIFPPPRWGRVRVGVIGHFRTKVSQERGTSK